MRFSPLSAGLVCMDSAYLGFPTYPVVSVRRDRTFVRDQKLRSSHRSH